MNTTEKTTDKDEKMEKLLKDLQEEQMRLHPEIYEKPKEETEN